MLWIEADADYTVADATMDSRLGHRNRRSNLRQRQRAWDQALELRPRSDALSQPEFADGAWQYRAAMGQTVSPRIESGSDVDQNIGATTWSVAGWPIRVCS